MACERTAEAPGRSLCDTCRLPGRCCVGFTIVNIPPGLTALEAMAWVTDRSPEPIAMMPLVRRENGVWGWWCPLLDHRTGRCTVYEIRPSMCSSYVAGSDGLCIEHCFQPGKDEWRRTA